MANAPVLKFAQPVADLTNLLWLFAVAASAFAVVREGLHLLRAAYAHRFAHVRALSRRRRVDQGAEVLRDQMRVAHGRADVREPRRADRARDSRTPRRWRFRSSRRQFALGALPRPQLLDVRQQLRDDLTADLGVAWARWRSDVESSARCSSRAVNMAGLTIALPSRGLPLASQVSGRKPS